MKAAEKTVSRSFLCLLFIVSQSVMPAERLVSFAGQNVLWCAEDVWLCLGSCISVVLMMMMIIIIIIIIIILLLLLLIIIDGCHNL